MRQAVTVSQEGAVRELLERAPLGLDLHEPQVEPEYVWRPGVTRRPRGFHVCFQTESGALRGRAERLADGGAVETQGPYRITLARALADLTSGQYSIASTLVLCDDDQNEVRRWTL